MDLDGFAGLLELHSDRPGYVAMGSRAVIVFVSALLIVRVGARRMLSKLSAFDMLLAIMIGSIASRAITGNSPFGPAIASIAALALLHWLFAYLSYRTDGLGRWIKGKPRRLVKDGQLQRDQMRRANITTSDLAECARSKGVAGGVEEIRDAWLERDGSISVAPRRDGEGKRGAGN